MKLYAFSIGFEQLDIQGAIQMFESITDLKINNIVEYFIDQEKTGEQLDVTGFPIYALNVNIAYIWFSLKEKPTGNNDVFFRIASNPETTTVKFIECGFIDIEI